MKHEVKQYAPMMLCTYYPTETGLKYRPRVIGAKSTMLASGGGVVWRLRFCVIPANSSTEICVFDRVSWHGRVWEGDAQYLEMNKWIVCKFPARSNRNLWDNMYKNVHWYNHTQADISFSWEIYKKNETQPDCLVVQTHDSSIWMLASDRNVRFIGWVWAVARSLVLGRWCWETHCGRCCATSGC